MATPGRATWHRVRIIARSASGGGGSSAPEVTIRRRSAGWGGTSTDTLLCRAPVFSHETWAGPQDRRLSPRDAGLAGPQMGDGGAARLGSEQTGHPPGDELQAER